MSELMILCGTENFKELLGQTASSEGFSLSGVRVVASEMVSPDFIQMVPVPNNLLYDASCEVGVKP